MASASVQSCEPAIPAYKREVCGAQRASQPAGGGRFAGYASAYPLFSFFTHRCSRQRVNLRVNDDTYLPSCILCTYRRRVGSYLPPLPPNKPLLPSTVDGVMQQVLFVTCEREVIHQGRHRQGNRQNDGRSAFGRWLLPHRDWS